MSVIQLDGGRKQFDLRTHIFDPKTGRIIKSQPYRKFVKGDSEWYERDGIRWTIGGECLDPEKLAGQKPPMVGAPSQERTQPDPSAVANRSVVSQAVSQEKNKAQAAVDVESELQ